MYVKPGCPYCEAARAHLDENGEAFTEVDATRDPLHRRQLMRLTKDTGVVPTIVREGGEVQVGFPPGRG